ncbi:uncharacterized protein LOC118756427, partial [Rhagoletis pomonella]|uniref:uncharacterized protein LOC118756427 n=1 Tax=Rhagoletis pomonella TaxID=28610 RepID=UPI0017875944
MLIKSCKPCQVLQSSPEKIKQKIIEKQEISERNYHGKRELELSQGQKVWIRDYSNPNKASWSPGTIREQLGPRSYCCTLLNNRTIKRHLNQIRPRNSNEASESANTIEVSESEATSNNSAEANPNTLVINDQSTSKSSNETSTKENTPQTVDDITPKRALRPRQDGKA